MPEKGEFIMPVPPEGAALQFFTEAMKANTEMLRQVSISMKGIQDEQKETLRTVHDTREKVIKLESTSQGKVVEELKAFVRDEFLKIDDRVETLERAQLVVDTRASTANWLVNHFWQLATLIGGVVFVTYLVLDKTGRLG